MNHFVKKSLLLIDENLLILPELNPTIVMDANGKSWLVSKVKNKFRIFRNECPHQGHDFRVTRTKFICKGHLWTFDSAGNNVVQHGQNLVEVEYTIDQQGRVFVNESEGVKRENSVRERRIPEDLQIEFISHACLRVCADGFRVMTDPWITPTTYWGHWKHWPTRQQQPKDFDTDAIVITHEHPDHFHIDSLKYFDRSIPIYIPNFISGRIQETLQDLGFKKVTSLEFDEDHVIQEDVHLTFIRPSSRWEDSISLLRFKDFSWLNLNDAGYIGNTSNLPGKIDLLSATFDIFATDYPQCWPDISSNKKISISKIAQNSIVEHLTNVTVKLNAKHFLPMASFWRLNGLEEIEAQMEHVTLDKIRAGFAKKGIEANYLDLHPGEIFSFNFERRLIERTPEKRRKISSGEYKDSNNYEIAEFIHQQIDEDTVATIVNYFKKLSQAAAAFQCEHVILEITSNGVQILSQEFASDDSAGGPVILEVDIPGWLLRGLAQNESNFEWIRIGYWAKFKRNKEIYTPNFLRLLAFGSSASKIFNTESEIKVEKETLRHYPIVKLMDRDPIHVSKILNRFGLPCFSCNKINMETLDQAFLVHNIGKNEQSDILAAIAAID